MYSLHYEKFQDGSVKCIEDEIPFELPEGWAWSRVRNIASVKGGKRLPKGMSFSDITTDHAYIRVTDMKNRSINTTGLKYISDEVFSTIKAYIISRNDLYVTIAGTIGMVGEVPDELDGMNLTENAVKVCNISINKTYLCYVKSLCLPQHSPPVCMCCIASCRYKYNSLIKRLSTDTCVLSSLIQRFYT